MKATMHTHHHSKLIADVIVPRRATNRRGHAMTENAPEEHQCHEPVLTARPLRPQKPLSLAKFSVLPGFLYSFKSVLPAWAPHKFTLEHGVQTNWEAALPSKQTMANTGVLAGFLVVAAFAVWALPQKNTPQVIAEQPTHVTVKTKSESSSPQATLAATNPTATSPEATAWKLPGTRKVTSGVIPALAVQPQPNTSSTATSPAATTQTSGASSPAETTPTATGGETVTTPTDPTTTPVDPTVDPPTEPTNPPVVIVDSPIIEDLLGLNLP